MGLDMEELTPEERATLDAIRAKKQRLVAAHRLKKGTANNQAVLPRRADAARTSTADNMQARDAAEGSSRKLHAPPPRGGRHAWCERALLHFV